jgi:quinol monooxygenase YgiN
MIHVIAIITTKPHQRSAVLELFKANLPVVRAEAGCIEYGPVIDVDGADPAFGPDTFVVVEKWESMAALKAHAVAPHMAAYGEKTRDLIAKRAVHVLTPA